MPTITALSPAWVMAEPPAPVMKTAGAESEHIMSSPLTLLMATGAAAFFVIANWIMKQYAGTALPLVIPAAAIALACGAVLEIEALKLNRLGHMIVLIVAIEVAATFALSIFMFGEAYSSSELVGVAVIGLGVLILTSAASVSPERVSELETVRQHIVKVKQESRQARDF
jgi:multidrug transporter EmrE-like cation transporter